MSTKKWMLTLGTTLVLATLASAPSPAAESSVVLDKHIEFGRLEPKTVGVDADMSLEARSRGLTLTTEKGRTKELHLISLYEPSRHLFWWTYQWVGSNPPEDPIADFDKQMSLTITEDAIVAAVLLAPPPSIWLHASTVRVDSHEEGEAMAVAEIEARHLSSDGLPIARYTQVNLHRVVPAEFFYPLQQGSRNLEAEVVSVEPAKAGWAITLAGRGDLRVEVLVDDQGAMESIRLADR